MFPSFIITFREVFEAALVVAMISGIFVRLGEKNKVRFVWMGAGAAVIVSIVLVFFGSYVGFVFQEFYTGRTEELMEGILSWLTAACVTWAVLTLDHHFRRYKLRLIQKINTEVKTGQMVGIFMLAFTSVFREGVEIILLLSTLLLTARPADVMYGFGWGVLVGGIASILIFTATIKLPVHAILRSTTILLVLFSAGLLAKGVHEFMELGLFSSVMSIPIPFVPARETIVGALMYGLFGIRNVMDIVQIVTYVTYTYIMIHLLALVPRRSPQQSPTP